MIYYKRDESGQLVGFRCNYKHYYYIKNLQNDIIGIMDDNYNVIANYKYDAYGKVISVTDENGEEITDLSHIAHINPFRYRSYYYDEETKLYYLNSRYYNPEFGRFINSDGYGGEIGNILTHNVFSYVLNSPIQNYDIEGDVPSIAIPNYFNNWQKELAEYSARAIVSSAIGALDGPFPFLDIIVAAANISLELEKAKEAAKTVTVEKTESMNPTRPAPKTPCTTAKLTENGVVRGKRLTINEAVAHSKAKGDLMCDNEPSALRVAKTYRKYIYHPEHKIADGY